MKYKWLPAVVILILGCIWGSSFILIKRGLLAFQPIQVAGWRIFLASVILLPWVLKYSFGKESRTADGSKLLTAKDKRNLFYSGLFGNGIPAFFFSYAGGLIPSGLSGILNALTPMFTLVVGILLFGDRFTRNGLLGVVAGITGALFLFVPGLADQIMHKTGGTPVHPGAVLLVLCAALMYGYNINLIKHRLHHLPAMVKTAFPFFYMGIIYAAILLTTRVQDAWAHNPEQAWKSFGLLLVLGVMGSAVSMIIFNILIRYTSALVASTNTFIIPLVAVAWGVADHENLSWNMFVGLLFSLLGVYLVMRKDKHMPQTEDDVEELKEFGE